MCLQTFLIVLRSLDEVKVRRKAGVDFYTMEPSQEFSPRIELEG
jgi:hypothetical protein